LIVGLLLAGSNDRLTYGNVRFSAASSRRGHRFPVGDSVALRPMDLEVPDDHDADTWHAQALDQLQQSECVKALPIRKLRPLDAANQRRNPLQRGHLARDDTKSAWRQ
jgi:hypothetical protein